MTNLPAVRSAHDHEGPLLADILTEAFAEDPVFGWFVRTDKKRKEAFTAVFRSSARRFCPTAPASLPKITLARRSGCLRYPPPKKPNRRS